MERRKLLDRNERGHLSARSNVLRSAKQSPPQEFTSGASELDRPFGTPLINFCSSSVVNRYALARSPIACGGQSTVLVVFPARLKKVHGVSGTCQMQRR